MLRYELLDPLQKIKPEPATTYEQECMQSLSLGDYEVYSEKLNMICEEAAVVFVRTGVSSLLHSGDLVVGLYDAKGNLVTASCGTFLHAVSGQVPIKFILEHWRDHPTVGVHEGDIFYCNEALYGGIHNPDQFAVIPIFHQGELLAWSVSGVHQPETGATDPGGTPISAKTRYDEGMKLPPIKVGERYQLKEDLLEMMANMVSRAPRMQVIDTRARATACDRVRKRIQQLAEQKGAAFLTGVFRSMIDRAAEAARRRIAGWHDGVFRHVYFMDTIGHSEALTRQMLTLRKQGDRLLFDFTGTSPEHDGSFHSLFHSAAAHVIHVLYCYAFHDLPVSSGIMVPLEFVAPPGTIISAGPDAACSNAPIVCTGVLNLTHVCMSKLLFDSDQRALATAPPYYGGSGNVVAGTNQWGARIADLLAYATNTSGGGARLDQDGVDSCGFPWCPWGKAPDAEDVETELPLLHLFQKHLMDSCGHGKYRGGSGTVSAVTVHQVPAMVATSTTKGSKFPQGAPLFGGYQTFTMPGTHVRETNLHAMLAEGSPELPSDVYELVEQRAIAGQYTFEANRRRPRPVQRGDVYSINSFGGGGYGDVLQRDPASVLEDVKKAVISRETAAAIYKVAFDPETLALDAAGTEALRDAERQDRLRRGRPYADFVPEWSAKRPPESILGYFGRWPDAAKTREIVRL